MSRSLCVLTYESLILSSMVQPYTIANNSVWCGLCGNNGSTSACSTWALAKDYASLAEKYKSLEPSLSNASAGGIGAGVTIIIGLVVLARESRHYLPPFTRAHSSHATSDASCWNHLIRQEETLNFRSIPFARFSIVQRIDRLELSIETAPKGQRTYRFGCSIDGCWYSISKSVLLYSRSGNVETASILCGKIPSLCILPNEP